MSKDKADKLRELQLPKHDEKENLNIKYLYYYPR